MVTTGTRYQPQQSVLYRHFGHRQTACIRNISAPHRSQITASLEAARCDVHDDGGVAGVEGRGLRVGSGMRAIITGEGTEGTGGTGFTTKKRSQRRRNGEARAERAEIAETFSLATSRPPPRAGRRPAAAGASACVLGGLCANTCLLRSSPFTSFLRCESSLPPQPPRHRHHPIDTHVIPSYPQPDQDSPPETA
jgi:hypothetical protein